MRILLSTKFYFPRGGDSVYTLALEKLLRDKGHETLAFSMDHPRNLPSPQASDFVSHIDFAESHERRSFRDTLRVPFRSVLSYEAYRNLDRLLAREKVDVAHLQNVHFQLTPSILYALRKHRVPVVWTLHDYVILCPASHFLSHGEICESCKPARYYQAVVKRCQRGSLSASLLAATASAVPRFLGSYRSVARFVTPSRFMREKFLDFGFPDRQLAQVPHFLDCVNIRPSREIGKYFLYVGRLSSEKGPEILLRAAPELTNEDIRLVGDGPDENRLRQEYGRQENVRFLGRREGQELRELFAGARAVVVPSVCYENFPMVILEAYAHGKPVVASRIGAIPELVEDGGTGLLFEPGNCAELASKLRELVRSPARAQDMGLRGRARVERELSPESHYRLLEPLYREVIAE
jgi:glycosyltransferase involved in cell wall biosynthesis